MRGDHKSPKVSVQERQVPSCAGDEVELREYERLSVLKASSRPLGSLHKVLSFPQQMHEEVLSPQQMCKVLSSPEHMHRAI